MSHIKISPSLLGLCGELRGSVRWRSSADVTFYWQAKSRERERAAPSSLPRGTSPTPPLVWEINVIGVAHQPASIWKEENEGKETRWFSPPGLVSSLWCTVATHTHTLFFDLLSSIFLGWNLSNQDGGYTVQPNSVVYTVICTSNLHLCWTLLWLIILQCHVIRRAQRRPAIKT